MAECVILIGLPGAGKTTFYRRYFAETHRHISKDLWPHARGREARLQQMLEDALTRGESVVIDNTASVESPQVVYWHREMPPAGAEAMGEHTIDLVHRVRDIVQPRIIVIGDEVRMNDQCGTAIWKLADIDWSPASQSHEPPEIKPDDTAEIIFTSGAPAEPKGVVITHKNLLANIVPIEREVAKYRKYARPFFPIRFLNLLPLSHMFGQAMATFISR